MILAGYIIADLACIRAFEHPVNANWDQANTQAALFAKKHPDAHIISTDWGIGTQIIGLTNDRPDVIDAWPTFSSQADAEIFLRDIKKDKYIYIYTRLPKFENVKGNRANLIFAMTKNHLSHEVAVTYPDWQGNTVIEIWKVSSESD
jgi:hypothetical protein